MRRKTDPSECRIVLTAGPGGGKTTAADLFRRELGERVGIEIEGGNPTRIEGLQEAVKIDRKLRAL
ncbi:MAG: ATP-binding protein [Proteobacteria bacterium]|nr:ATP-binding protein [Pseudomonadota bacterium]